MSDIKEKRTISDPGVLQRYILGGDVAKSVAKQLIAKLVDGASVRQICIEGEELIDEEMKNVLKKEKKLKKGVAFPVCICVNNCISHFSPLHSDDDVILKDGDVAKLDMAVHVDGFVSSLAHSVVVGASAKKPVEKRKADAILAAQYALRAAVMMLENGNTNYSLTDTVTKVAKSYKCLPVQGMFSFQLEEDRIEGEKIIIQNPTEAHKKEIEKCTFETNEVYAIDCIISTGAGKGREMEARTTVYSRTDEIYKLKLKTSKEFYSKVYKNHNLFPFNLRNFEDEKRARMGVQECVSHKLVDPYPVLFEKANEIVGQFKTTVIISSKGLNNITQLEFDDSLYKTENKIEDTELLELITKYDSTFKRKANKKKKNASSESNNQEQANDNSNKTKGSPKKNVGKIKVTPKKDESKKAEVNSKTDEKKSKKNEGKLKQDENISKTAKKEDSNSKNDVKKSKKNEGKVKKDENISKTAKKEDSNSKNDAKNSKKNEGKLKKDENMSRAAKKEDDNSKNDEKKSKKNEGKVKKDEKVSMKSENKPKKENLNSKNEKKTKKEDMNSAKDENKPKKEDLKSKNEKNTKKEDMNSAKDENNPKKEDLNSKNEKKNKKEDINSVKDENKTKENDDKSKAEITIKP